jgi:hypothetical protein
MKEVLLGMHVAACEWREQGATCLPTLERDDWVSQYFDVLARGFAAQPPVLATWNIRSEEANVRAIEPAFTGCKKTCSRGKI